MLLAVLFFTGCSGSGTLYSDDPRVSSVAVASLNVDVSETDFSSTDYSMLASKILVPETNIQAVMLMGTLLKVVGDESKQFVDDLDDNDLLDAWLDTYFRMVQVPDGSASLPAPPAYVSIDAIVRNAPFSFNYSDIQNTIFALLNGAANTSANITWLGNKVPSHINLSMSLENADYDLTDEIDKIVVKVEDGKMGMSVNLNLDLNLSWVYDAVEDKYNLTGFDGAYSLSARMKVALSGYSSIQAMGGHVLAELSLDDSDTIVLTTSMLTDPSFDMSDYLDALLVPDSFSFTIKAYGDPKEAATFDAVLDFESFLSLIEGFTL